MVPNLASPERSTVFVCDTARVFPPQSSVTLEYREREEREEREKRGEREREEKEERKDEDVREVNEERETREEAGAGSGLVCVAVNAHARPREMFHRLLRPELVLRSPTPLSPDVHFKDQETPHKLEVAKATAFLLGSAIPYFASFLERQEKFLDPHSPVFSTNFFLHEISHPTSSSSDDSDTIRNSLPRRHECEMRDLYADHGPELAMSLGFVLKTLHEHGINIRCV